MSEKERTLFLADMHLPPADIKSNDARDRLVKENCRLRTFLQTEARNANRLILLGDTFHGWFERRCRVVGDFKESLRLFKEAADKGLMIHHVSGNWDFAVGEGLDGDPVTHYKGLLRLNGRFTISALTDYGIEPHGPRYRFRQDGHYVSCIHGDSLCRQDRLFRFCHWLIRGWPGVALMRYTPWFIATPWAKWYQSHPFRNRLPDPGSERQLDTRAAEKELLGGGDILVCGHVHYEYRKELTVAGKPGLLLAIPPWANGFYGEMVNGEVHVKRFE